MTRQRAAGWVLYAAAWIGYVAVLYDRVLSGTRHTALRQYNLIPFTSISDTLSSPLSMSGKVLILGGNLLLMAPVAVLVALVTRRRRTVLKVTAAALGASLAIETAQYVMPSGRSADIDDVILNTGGALMTAVLIAVIAPRAIGWLRGDQVATRSKPVPHGARHGLRTSDELIAEGVAVGLEVQDRDGAPPRG